MKRIIALLMALVMILCLCACGAKEEPAAPAASESNTQPAAPAASESDAQPAAPAADSASNVVVAPAAEEESVNGEMFALAEECISLPVSDLFAAIGEPDSTEYSSSCLVEDAEDGVLYYNDYGFYVFSLREADGTETVQAILEL